MQVLGVQVAPSYDSSFRVCAAYELFRPSNNRPYAVYNYTEESEPTIWVISIRAPSKTFLKHPVILWNLGGSLLRDSQKRCFAASENVSIASDYCYRLLQDWFIDIVLSIRYYEFADI